MHHHRKNFLARHLVRIAEHPTAYQQEVLRTVNRRSRFDARRSRRRAMQRLARAGAIIRSAITFAAIIALLIALFYISAFAACALADSLPAPPAGWARQLPTG